MNGSNRNLVGRSRLSAPIVVTIGLLAGCGGAQEQRTNNPPGHEHPEHENPPPPEGSGEGTEIANPPGHPDTPHNNPPAPAPEEGPPGNPPAPEGAGDNG